MSDANSGARKVKPVLRELSQAKLHPGEPTRLFSEHDSQRQVISYSELAAIIDRQSRHTIFVLDNSFIGRHEIDQPVWDALFNKRVAIPYFVWQELQEWLNKPFANADAAKQIQQAVGCSSSHIILDHETPFPSDYMKARQYYVTLLSSRKQRSLNLVEKFSAEYGRLPDAVEMNRLFQRAGNDRDFHLLRKGYNEYKKQNFFADEDVVVFAVMIAIIAGCETVILTRDGDILDQFCKCTDLLTVQYLAMQFAKQYAARPDSYATSPMPRGIPEIEAYFNSAKSLLVRKPVIDLDTFAEAVLPSEHQVVPITCVLLGGPPGQMTRSFVRYFAEKEMMELLEAKGQTLGLNSNRLGGRNCHVTGFPKGIENPREWVVICEDNYPSSQQGGVRIPQLDYAHANFHFGTRRRFATPASSGGIS